VRAGGLILTLALGATYRVGRDPESDVAMDDPRVSWQHAVLRMEQDQWLLEDLGSTNGTFLGPDRVRRVEITGVCHGRASFRPSATNCRSSSTPATSPW
jgi:pSer/pThr/pTyr-binding forkhead associated (FHA) protein